MRYYKPKIRPRLTHSQSHFQSDLLSFTLPGRFYTSSPAFSPPLRRVSQNRATGLFAAVFAAILLAFSPVAWADEGDVENRINDFIAAGEFGPAINLAGRLGDEATRDRLLTRIARAQARAGARRASVSTAGGIDDDVRRSEALNAARSAPGGFFGGAAPGARGGGAVVDFDALIELIQNTTGTVDSWSELGGGEGTIEPFQGSGVYVNPDGVLRKLKIEDGARALASLRRDAARSSGNTDVRRPSTLRKISLTRLEKQVQLLDALGKKPDEAMMSLAGVNKVTHVFVYPESGDIVLAGPAGDWTINAEGRRISTNTGRPVLNLDDLVVALQNAFLEGGRFGCSIDPRKENLARARQFLAETAGKKFTSTRQRDEWMEELRSRLGKQDITVFGIDPRTRASWIIIEADYHMKLVGMGLAEGTLGVTSYLDMLAGRDDEAANMDVLRWWFTLNYDAIHTTEDHNAFELRGQAVKVMSENELLTQRGERVHTGKSDLLNSEFAHSFTKHFDKLAAKYPIYQELANVFDMALVASLIRTQDLPNQVGWKLTHFLPSQESSGSSYQVALHATPKFTETIVNSCTATKTTGRGVKTKRIVTGVSGGVTFDSAALVKRESLRQDNYGLLKSAREDSVPKDLPQDAWWWD